MQDTRHVVRRSMRSIRQAVVERAVTSNFISLLRASSREVVVVEGLLEERVYGAKRLLRMLKKTTRHGVGVTFWVGRNPDDLLREKLEDAGVRIRILDQYPMLHFAIGDRRHIRYEGIHTIGHPVPRNTLRLSGNTARQAIRLLGGLQQMASGSPPPPNRPSDTGVPP